MKKKLVIILVLTLVSVTGFYGYQSMRQRDQAKREMGVSYIDEELPENQISSSQVTPEQISDKESIAAEQIVVNITDQGYVTSHGDHFHYYNGKVPFDAILSEELIMKDPNYAFQESQVVNEVQDGSIIKVDDQYYLYVKNTQQTKNVRTKDEVDRQREIAAIETTTITEN